MPPRVPQTTHMMTLPILKRHLTTQSVQVLHEVEPVKRILETVKVKTLVLGPHIYIPYVA